MIKRIFDVAGASVALILVAPLLVMVAGLIRIATGGPAVMAEKRVGLAGREFRCYRFATAAQDPTGYLGAIVTESGIDKLLQLFNVLRGEMSLVGPRPCAPREMACYGRHARACLRARPGLTGIWQTSSRAPENFSARIAHDLYYVRRWSIWLDLQVLAKAFRLA